MFGKPKQTLKKSIEFAGSAARSPKIAAKEGTGIAASTQAHIMALFRPFLLVFITFPNTDIISLSFFEFFFVNEHIRSTLRQVLSASFHNDHFHDVISDTDDTFLMSEGKKS